MRDGPTAAGRAKRLTGDELLESQSGISPGRSRRVWLLTALGPGLIVMLADTDAGSVITAGQSGARYGYQFIVAQVLLIPVLYLVQEMTARLGLVTGQGHGTLIRSLFGARWALLSAAGLFVVCVGALITEFAGLAGVGGLMGIPRGLSIGAPTLALVSLVLLGRYRRIEHIGIAIGALELLFVPAAFMSHPRGDALLSAVAHPVQLDGRFLTLLAANVGAVIMPWMIFYQQEAVIDRGRGEGGLRAALRAARLDTAFGSVTTQIVMISVMVAVAATIGRSHPGTGLSSIGDMAAALTPVLGHTSAVIFFGLGMLGAATVAALVVSLAGAWGISEVLGWRHSLNDSPRRAAGFYALAVTGMLLGALLVLLTPNLVALSVGIEVVNAGLLPLFLTTLLVLERRSLPQEYRMRGPRRVVTYGTTGLVIAFGLFTVAQGLTGRL